MRQPGLQVRVIDYEALSVQAARPSNVHLFFDIDKGFVSLTTLPVTTTASAPPLAPPTLQQVLPARTQVGQGFNVQRDGQSALAVICTNATPDTTIVFGMTPLTTFYGGSTWLSAIVPPDLYARPGRYPIYLVNRAGESSRIEFIVDD
jgi:hypothetical protein